ncbi:MAG: cytochrome c oxidase subunit 3 [Saprospiraceae bacterium]
MSVIVQKQTSSKSKIHPKKFGLYIAFASIIMMFTGLTSAHIVRQSAGNWLEFKIPSIFFISTFVILLSSLTLHLSYKGFLNGNERQYKWLLLLSAILGFTFIILQYEGWLQLNAIGVDLKGNPSGSFVYAISGIHAAHVLGGIGAIAIALLHAFSLKYKVTPVRKLRFELTAHYWHFVDFLWVYLIVFLVLQH